MSSSMGAVSLEPQAVDVDVKIVLIGAVEHFYELQEGDPEFARHFRVKVDFADSFIATEATRRATGIFVAQACRRLALPHFSAAAVARLVEETHREADDQTRQSAIFARTEAGTPARVIRGRSAWPRWRPRWPRAPRAMTPWPSGCANRWPRATG